MSLANICDVDKQYFDGGIAKAHHLLSGRLLKLSVAIVVGIGTLSAVITLMVGTTAAQSSSVKLRKRDNERYVIDGAYIKHALSNPSIGKRRSSKGGKMSSGRPLAIIREFPRNHSLNANGLGAIVVNFNSPLAKKTKHPVISPKVQGRWQKTNTSFIFRPKVPILPNTLEVVKVPAGIATKRGAKLSDSASFEFATRSGSILRADEILAELNYLPFDFTPSQAAARRSHISLTAAAKYLWDAPTGTFKWDFTPPASLAADWTPGVQNTMFQGALVAFEADHNLPMSTTISTQDWETLLRASMDPTAYRNPHGYNYALAQEGSPETLTIYNNGKVVLDTPANTGIAVSPTTLGTFYVYEKLPYQVMKGINPDGVPYADPVQYVSYFYGSEAVHYFYRAEYGFPQSLGCIELPFSAAATAYSYLPYGTLVTVIP